MVWLWNLLTSGNTGYARPTIAEEAPQTLWFTSLKLRLLATLPSTELHFNWLILDCLHGPGRFKLIHPEPSQSWEREKPATVSEFGCLDLNKGLLLTLWGSIAQILKVKKKTKVDLTYNHHCPSLANFSFRVISILTFQCDETLVEVNTL